MRLTKTGLGRIWPVEFSSLREILFDSRFERITMVGGRQGRPVRGSLQSCRAEIMEALTRVVTRKTERNGSGFLIFSPPDKVDGFAHIWIWEV